MTKYRDPVTEASAHAAKDLALLLDHVRPRARSRIGQFLRAWREKRDLTVRDAAPMFGISIATLSRIERGGQMDAGTQIKLIVFLFGTEDAASVSEIGSLRSEAQK